LVWRQLELYATKTQGAGVISRKELSRVHDITTELDNEVQHLERLLSYNLATTPRKRRGLIDFGGQVLKFLFGTATHSEVQDLQSIVSKYEDQGDDTIHALTAQLTLIRTVDKETRQNTVDLLDQARILRQILFEVINVNRTLLDADDRLEAAFEIQRNISSSMRELEFTALRLQQELTQLHEGLDVTSSGRLSSVLIPPNNLSALLQQIALRLPRDVSFITNTDIDNMYVYYDVACVQAYATAGAIRFIVRIPLRGADCIMTLYRVEPLPTFYTLIKRPIQIETETTYFAVTENRQYYALLKEVDVEKCEHGLITICEANFPLIHKRVPSCMSALYFGQINVAYTLCRKLILQENFKPVWIYAKNKNAFWVYSLPAPTRVTKTCKVNGTTKSNDMMLTGAGILQENTNCQYFSEAFILLPETDSYANFTLTVGHIIAPDLPQLVSTEENHQLEEYSEEANSTLRALEAMMRRDTSTNQQNYVELKSFNPYDRTEKICSTHYSMDHH
jgi:hypothetical protein